MLGKPATKSCLEFKCVGHLLIMQLRMVVRSFLVKGHILSNPHPCKFLTCGCYRIKPSQWCHRVHQKTACFKMANISHVVINRLVSFNNNYTIASLGGFCCSGRGHSWCVTWLHSHIAAQNSRFVQLRSSLIEMFWLYWSLSCSFSPVKAQHFRQHWKWELSGFLFP